MSQKLRDLFMSRKFWALVASLATTAGMFASKQVTGAQALAAVIASLSAYKLGTAIEAAKVGP